jgi:hypothetical protein
MGRISLTLKSAICFGIPLLFVIAFGDEDVIGEYLRENQNEAEIEVDPPDPDQAGQDEEKRIEIDWAYSPIDLRQLAKLEDTLYQNFGVDTESKKEKVFYEKRALGSSNFDEVQWQVYQ